MSKNVLFCYLITVILPLFIPHYAFATEQRKAESIGINVRSNWAYEIQLDTNKIAPYIATISQTRAGFVRLFVSWNSIQPEEKNNTPPAEWNWNKLDLMISTITASGMKPLLVLYNQPAWATQATTNDESNNYLPYKVPWGNFVTALIHRYGYVQGGRQQVKYWEILNEPDAPGRHYTPYQYGEFLTFTYPLITSLDPQAKVLNGGLTQMSVIEDKGDWLKKFLSYNNAGFARHFDYFSIHRYGAIDTAGYIVTKTKEIFQTQGVSKPIWVTETNIGNNVYKPTIICNPAGEETKYLTFKTLFGNILQAGADKVFLLSAECTSWAGPGIFIHGSTTVNSPNLVIIHNALTALTEAVGSFITGNPADLEPDGDVDIFDFNSLVSHFGQTGAVGWIRADIIKNGVVDIFDFNKLVENFGR